MNIQVEGKTAFEKRFGVDFDGPIWAMGIEIEWLPQSKADKARIHSFGKKKLEGVFLGYVQEPGGGWSDTSL